MKNIKKIKAFSLAELMIVLLIMTIILAATMPVLSKRAKIKASSVGSSSSSNVRACGKTVTSTLPTTTIPAGVIYFYYQMYGGGGGAQGIDTQSASAGGGGGGGASVILIDGVVKAEADGGTGAGYIDLRSYTAYAASPGIAAQGTLFIDPSTSHTISVYAGGGGGAGATTAPDGSYQGFTYFVGGGGGAGGGGAAAGYTGYGQPGSIPIGSTTVPNGTDTSAFSNSSLIAHGGSSTGGITNTNSGGGGAFGGNGGTSINTKSGPYNIYSIPGENGHTATTTPGMGKAGVGSWSADFKTYTATGGQGGSVMFFFMTTASTCPSL